MKSSSTKEMNAAVGYGKERGGKRLVSHPTCHAARQSSIAQGISPSFRELFLFFPFVSDAENYF
jgi:hypothetical protein